MKRVLFLLVFLSGFTSAQFKSLNPNEGLLGAGLGLTWIDNQPYYSFHFTPEIAFANMGIGLNLNFEISPQGKIRNENFNEFTDYLSILRYFRYGHKNDPVYFRLGALDYATLGHGTIMYMYNNSPTYDARRIGAELDLDLTQFGFEFVYGNFLQAGVVGLRGYVRPLKFSSAGSIPIIGNLEFGATVVTDLNKNAGIYQAVYESSSDELTQIKDEGKTTIIGFDVGLPIVSSEMFNWQLYYDFNKILKFGTGSAAGTMFRFNGLGLVNLTLKFERRFNKDHYMPSYFNSLYEIERFRLDKATGQISSKIQKLRQINAAAGNGWYGELFVNVLNSFNVIGSYQRLDSQPKSGILHLSADVSPKDVSFIARAGYDKINIESEKDIFTLDDRSYLFVEFGYKPMPYLVVSIVYNWTFTPVRDANSNIIGYKPQKKIEPRVSFVYPLNF